MQRAPCLAKAEWPCSRGGGALIASAAAHHELFKALPRVRHHAHLVLACPGCAGAVLLSACSSARRRRRRRGARDAAPHAADLRVGRRALGAVAEHAHQRVPAMPVTAFRLLGHQPCSEATGTCLHQCAHRWRFQDASIVPRHTRGDLCGLLAELAHPRAYKKATRSTVSCDHDGQVQPALGSPLPRQQLPGIDFR